MALRAKAVRRWYLVHKWTSLVCTAFLLMLCVTGLPLIFHHEIDHALGNTIDAPELSEAIGPADLDRVVEAARQRRPGETIQFVTWDIDEPDIRLVGMAPAVDSPPDDVRYVAVDGRTAEALGEPSLQEGLMATLLTLHTDMFAGQAGKLFLGVMGLLFVAAIVSGLVLYGPFMRKLEFGTVRRGRAARLKWLDLHNLLGIVTLTWAIVVGVTGTINTWVDQVVKVWRADQLSEMVAPYRDKPPLTRLGSLERAVATARAAAPDMTPSFVAFPGSLLTSNHHYAVFMRGETPLTSRLLKPVLIDAEDGTLTDSRTMPWYVTTLLVSQPLHFGDYGGLPLKIIWAVLDIITIVVLGSGLYLWLARRRTPIEARIASLEREQLDALAEAPGESR